MREIDHIGVAAESAAIYEHGWQSWSPGGRYPLRARPPRPGTDNSRVMNWRQDTRPPADAFWGEGLLAVDPGDGSGIVVFSAAPGADPVPSIRADVRTGEVAVSADGPLLRTVDTGANSVEDALGRWADAYAAAAGVSLRAESPTVWCSWYHYFRDVTEDDIFENLSAMDDLGLSVDVVQIDDGYQSEIGDWLTESGRFTSLEAAVARIRAAGRRAGLWLAPFLVSPRSRIYQDHPEWLLGGARAGFNWKAEQAVLDVTHPGAEEYLRTVFCTLRRMGIDYFKLDFLYAGALAGQRADDSVTPLAAYRHGMEMIREAIGPDSYLLGCGAPILPSVGLVDAMRVSPDTAPRYEPDGGDLSMPSQRAAALTGRARAWQHGRFWANDPDCLIVRPEVQRRDAWAVHIDRYGGLRSSSDRLRDLDDWGLSTTRRLLRRTPVRPFTNLGV
ncbi:MAG TPA: glycoside hydrolase family 36 protein [Trebonia sp.]